MRLLIVLILIQLSFHWVLSLKDESDHGSAKLNVTLATIYQLLENNTNQVFPSDQDKEVFLNHFQFVLDSVLDKKQENNLILEGHPSIETTNEILTDEVSIPLANKPVEEESRVDDQVSSQGERKEDRQSSVINPDNVTVWELFKLQVQQDFAPFLLLIPKPVKQRIAEEVRQSSHRVRLILSGALSPMLFSLSKLINNLGQSLQRIAQEAEDFYAKNKPVTSGSVSTTAVTKEIHNNHQTHTNTNNSNNNNGSRKEESLASSELEIEGEEEEVIEL
eukprot:gene7543-8142_t